ncbi:MAG TPA: DoxX family protein [Planctomycetota bacterium]|nr:DoxX family protein [Planctomycetota bacterium]
MVARIGALTHRVTALLTRLEGLPILLARIVLGLGFAQTGYGKVFTNHGNVVQFFTTLGIPLPELNAWFVGGLEFFGGLLLIVGLCSRGVAFLLSCTMLVATLTSTLPDLHKDGKGILDALLTPEILAFVMLVWLVFSGPGPFSLDRLVAKKFAPTPPPKPGA